MLFPDYLCRYVLLIIRVSVYFCCLLLLLIVTEILSMQKLNKNITAPLFYPLDSITFPVCHLTLSSPQSPLTKVTYYITVLLLSRAVSFSPVLTAVD